jgi:sugar fermentation stimulation protein A
MLFPQPLRRGRLVRRYKRFLADVVMDDAEETVVHVPNPGAMLGLAEPGMRVWCSTSTSASRKLPMTWELVEADGGLVGINTIRPNALVAEALAAGLIPELAGFGAVRREVVEPQGSRIDFLLETTGSEPLSAPTSCSPERSVGGAKRLWLEVKNCHLMRTPGLAEFPDCRAARSAKHLRALQARKEAGDEAAVLWVVQRMDCQAFALAEDIDPDLGEALRAARAAGVCALVYDCDVAPGGVRIRSSLPVTTPNRTSALASQACGRTPRLSGSA